MSGSLRALVLHVSRALCAFLPHVPHTLRALMLLVLRALRVFVFHVLTIPTVKQYDKQSLLKEYYYRGFFISDINLQDPLIYLNLTSLIHQPAFIRKPTL